MKTNKLVYLSFSVISLFSLCSLAFVKQKIVKVEAYPTSSLPTTIDLNDCSESEIRNYYKDIENLSGNSLLIALKKVLVSGQKYYSFSTNIWQMYEIADRDWTLSPASSTTYGNYDANSNMITNYQYGASASNSKNNPYLHSLYFNREGENKNRAWGNHNQDQWGINREHVWPKSCGFNASTANGAFSDLMHLMSGNGYANNIHGNNFYGYVDKTSEYQDCGSKYNNLSGNLLGISKTLGSGMVFEPQECDKGDIARAVFYMATRYQNLAMDDVTSLENPNLKLVNEVLNEAAYVSTDSNPGKMGIISDLLEWNRLDPPDEYEIHRNNLLYKNYTNNRNPYIDYPEWAEAVWGRSKNGVYDEEATHLVSASNDLINQLHDDGWEPGQEVKIEDLEFSKKEINISIGEVAELRPTITPANANKYSLEWSSSDSSIALVDQNGLVTGMKAGKCTITVYDKISFVSAECVINVKGGSNNPLPFCGGNISFTSTTLFITAGCGIILFFFRRKPKKQ